MALADYSIEDLQAEIQSRQKASIDRIGQAIRAEDVYVDLTNTGIRTKWMPKPNIGIEGADKENPAILKLQDRIDSLENQVNNLNHIVDNVRQYGLPVEMINGLGGDCCEDDVQDSTPSEYKDVYMLSINTDGLGDYVQQKIHADTMSEQVKKSLPHAIIITLYGPSVNDSLVLIKSGMY